MAERFITFSAPIMGADTERRTITGLVAPYGQVGNTSAGPTTFEAGAFGDELDPQSVRLVMEHEDARPIGRALSLVASDDGITGTFTVSRTTAGNDALVEAADGLRDGLSVGAVIADGGARTDENGVLRVTSARIKHVGLVTEPAFQTAKVTQVAASNNKDITEMDTETKAAEHIDAATDNDDNSVTTTASKPHVEVVTHTPVPRHVATTNHTGEFDVSAGAFLQRMIRAQNGHSDSREWLEAALDQTKLADVPGVVPTNFANEVIGIVDASRRFINSIEKRPLPPGGMSFKVPTRISTRATVGQHTEATEVTSTSSTLTSTEVDVQYFSGANRVSIEVIERSDPSYLNELLLQHAESYAQQTEQWAITQALTGAQTADAGSDVPESIVNAIATSAEAYKNSPDSMLMQLGFWKSLKNAQDSANRPLFPHLNPSNAPGQLRGNSLSGEVEGLAAQVSFNYTSDHATPTPGAFVYPSSALRFYESGPVQVRAFQVSSLEWEFGIYGAVGFLPKVANAVVEIDLP